MLNKQKQMRKNSALNFSHKYTIRMLMFESFVGICCRDKGSRGSKCNLHILSGETSSYVGNPHKKQQMHRE